MAPPPVEAPVVAETFFIKRNDLLPTLRVTLLDDSEPVDLTNAGSARFVMSSLTGVKVDQPMEILSQGENTGQVEYIWQPGDTDTVGSFNAEVEVLWAGQVRQTFPSNGYFRIRVTKDLNDT